MRFKNPAERRTKKRFPLNSDLSYKILNDERIVAAGRGTAANMSSGGIAFECPADLPAGSFIELSISWPALLNGVCPMRLIVFGEVLRGSDGTKACSVEKWEFRTQARQVAPLPMPLRIDSKLQRWMEYRKEVGVRTAAAAPPA
jgi:hypothetical protein